MNTTRLAIAFRLIGAIICAEALLRRRSTLAVEFRARCVVSAAETVARLHDGTCDAVLDDCRSCRYVQRARGDIERQAGILRSEAYRRGLLAPPLRELLRIEADERWMDADRTRVREEIAAEHAAAA